MLESVAYGSLLKIKVGLGGLVELQLTGGIRVLYLIVGGAVLIAVIVDLLWTTLWVDGGAGPISSRLTSWTWQVLRKGNTGRSKALSLAGPIILTLTLTVWVGLLWGGWTLVFAGGENALIDTRDPGPISWTERLYFVAYSMFTMGNGDFTPTDGIWQIFTSLTTASGMLFITMGVSYVLSVLGAVVDKRSFASSVTGVAERSEEFVRNGWNGEDFHQLDLMLNSLAPEIGRLANQHKAYPILHYYHSERVEESSAVAVAILDEALEVLRFGIPKPHRPNEVLITSTRSSIQDYLRTLSSAYIHPVDREPPPPDLGKLRVGGIPVVQEAEFNEALENQSERRQKLLAVVDADAWNWPPPNDE